MAIQTRMRWSSAKKAVPRVNEKMNETLTSTADYVEYLQNQSRGWTRFVDVPIPYRFNIRPTCIGSVLEVSYRISRHLKFAVDRSYSFLFPRLAGSSFKRNKFVFVANAKTL